MAAGLGLAFVFGLIAARLKLPLILGYLAAGLVIGPATPGWVADSNVANQLSEIGVILLMFGVGLHFSLADLWAVRRVAIPGALIRIVLATFVGAIIVRMIGVSWGPGIIFGLCLSVSSTVVLLRALAERDEIESAHGRIAVGWLIIEDVVTVAA
ncbi:MAG: cation:proton antiporter [Fimbriimonadales bacterium]